MRISDWSSDVCSSDLALGVGELFLELRNRAVGKLASAREITTALRLIEFEPRRVQPLLELGGARDLVLLGLPARGQFGRLLFEIGEVGLEAFEPILRRLIVLALQRLALNLELDDPAVERSEEHTS